MRLGRSAGRATARASYQDSNLVHTPIRAGSDYVHQRRIAEDPAAEPSVSTVPYLLDITNPGARSSSDHAYVVGMRAWMKL